MEWNVQVRGKSQYLHLCCQWDQHINNHDITGCIRRRTLLKINSCSLFILTQIFNSSTDAHRCSTPGHAFRQCLPRMMSYRDLNPAMVQPLRLCIMTTITRTFQHLLLLETTWTNSSAAFNEYSLVSDWSISVSYRDLYMFVSCIKIVVALYQRKPY